MKKNILVCFVLLCGCNQPEKKNAAGDLQKLTSLLPTANWLITSGTDTSYIYFSQQFDNTYKTYEYKLVHGDSLITWRGNVLASADSVVWSWNQHDLWLQEISDSTANWKDKKTNASYVLQRINDSSLQLRSFSSQLTLTRTLPLSTFLVRANYDYKHETKFLDSAEVPSRKSK